jgi:hypothetical protein
MDRLVELLSACSTSVASTNRCGVRAVGVGGVDNDDDEDVAATVPINGASHVNSKKSGSSNSSVFLCGSLRDAFLGEQTEKHVVTTTTTTRATDPERDKNQGAHQDDENEEEEDDDMSNLWKDLIMYDDYKPPIPRIIETMAIPSPTSTPPKHEKHLVRTNSKIRSSISNTENGKGKVNRNVNMSLTTNINNDYTDRPQQQPHHQQHQRVEEDYDSLMGLDLLIAEETQKDAELPRSPAALLPSTTTTSTAATSASASTAQRRDDVWPGGAKTFAVAAATATDGGDTAAAVAKPFFSHSSSQSWTYSLTNCEPGGLSSTGLGGGTSGGGGDETSPCPSSWSDEFLDVNDELGANTIDALCFGELSSHSNNGQGGAGVGVGGFRAKLASGCGGELDDKNDHEGSSYSGDKSSSLLLLKGGLGGGGTGPTSVTKTPPPFSTIVTTKMISSKATTRATTRTTSPISSHGQYYRHQQPQQQIQPQQPPQQPLLPASPQQKQLQSRHLKMKNSYNSATLATLSTSDSATLNCSTLATQDDDEDVIDNDPSQHQYLYPRLNHHHNEHDETQDPRNIEEVDSASI